MPEVAPQDSRGLFMLPQAPEGAGYYTYDHFHVQF